MRGRDADPDEVERLVDEAEDLLAEGRLDEALAAWDRALAAGRDDPELLLDAADLYVNRLPDDARDREALERGIALARSAGKLARKAGDDAAAGEAAWLEGAALTQLGRPAEALPLLDAAARALPDAVAVALERGVALYELCRWDEARAALLAAERLDRDDAWVQHHLGLVAERQGDGQEARRRFDRARKLAPDDFPRPIALSRPAFDAAVEEALAGLPEPVRRHLANVAVTVEDLPAEDDLLAADPPLSPTSLGLFRGAGFARAGAVDASTQLPPSIVLFQKNLERFARSREELADEIRVTLVHEVGHFLGLDEDELYERGLD